MASTIGCSCSRSPFHTLFTNQPVEVLILDIVTPKFVKVVEDPLSVCDAHILRAAVRAATGKAHQLLCSSARAVVGSVARSRVLLQLPFLPCPLLVSQSLSSTPSLRDALSSRAFRRRKNDVSRKQAGTETRYRDAWRTILGLAILQRVRDVIRYHMI